MLLRFRDGVIYLYIWSVLHDIQKKTERSLNPAAAERRWSKGMEKEGGCIWKPL